MIFDDFTGFLPSTPPPGSPPGPPGSLGTITIPGRQLKLKGLTLNVQGGSWNIGGTSGTTPRDVAVRLTNQYELALQENLAKFQADQISRSEALSNFDRIWADYIQALTPVGEVEKGRAISDRQRGGQFDWYRAYRDPVGEGGGIVPWAGRTNIWIILLVVAGLLVFKKVL